MRKQNQKRKKDGYTAQQIITMKKLAKKRNMNMYIKTIYGIVYTVLPDTFIESEKGFITFSDKVTGKDKDCPDLTLLADKIALMTIRRIKVASHE